MRSSWLAILVAATAACGGGNAAQGTLGNSGGGGGSSLAVALAAGIGGGLPVAIVPSPQGLRAISADGAREQVLVPGAVAWALVDNRANVVWFGTDDASAIQVLDLESPAASPAITTVVTGIPTETDAGTPLVTISYPDPSSDVPTSDEMSIGHGIMPHVVLHVAPEPSLGAVGGILEMWEQQAEFEAKVQQASIVAAPLLAQLAARGAGRSLALPRSPKQHRVEVEDLSSCEEPDTCGEAEEITPSLWRVVTSYSCGDGCYTGWQLYDPQAKHLVDAEWAKLVSDAWLARDASAFVTAGQVIRLDGGPLAATPSTEDGLGMGGGWLGGGFYLP